MEVLSYWEQKGLKQGLQEGRKEGKATGLREGKIELANRLLARKFGAEAASLLDRMQKLSPTDLDKFGEAILDFATLDQAQAWLETSSDTSDAR